MSGWRRQGQRKQKHEKKCQAHQLAGHDFNVTVAAPDGIKRPGANDLRIEQRVAGGLGGQDEHEAEIFHKMQRQIGEHPPCHGQPVVDKKHDSPNADDRHPDCHQQHGVQGFAAGCYQA